MTRRKRGEGSIYYRPIDNRWCADITIGRGADGRRIRRHFYGRTEEEAATKLMKARGRIARGLPATGSTQPLADFLRYWLDEVKVHELAPATLDSYRMIAERHLIPALGEVQVSKVTAQDVQALIHKGLSCGLSASTVRYHHRVLSTALRYALRGHLVEENVATLVTAPRAQSAEIEPLTRAQLREFLEGTAGDRLHSLYTLAIATGARQGELLGLRWSDVDFETSVLSIERSLQYRKLNWYVQPTKSRGRRAFPVPASVLRALNHQRELQAAEKTIQDRLWNSAKQRVGRWQDDPGLGDLIFRDFLGRPLSPFKLTRDFQKALAALGLPHKRFHDLRHSAAAAALAESVPLAVLSRMLGHKSVATTADLYGHIQSEQQGDAVSAIAAAVLL